MSEQRELKRTRRLESAGWPDDEYSADLGHEREAVDIGDTTPVTRPLGHHEAPAARHRLGKAADALVVLQPGTRLQAGSTYLDLERLDEGPLVARAGQEVGKDEIIVSKHGLDYETWNTLTGERHDD